MNKYFLSNVFLVTLAILSSSGYRLKQTILCVLQDNTLASTENINLEDHNHSIPGFCEGTFQLGNFSPNESSRLIKSGTVVTFLKGAHELHFQWTFINLNDLTLTADPTSKVNIYCSNHGGIVFQNITNLSVVGLLFEHCGTRTTTPDAVPQSTKYTLSTLAFLYGKNLNISDVSISHTTTGLCIWDVAGIVDIKNVHVSDALSHERDIQGGNIIAYNFEKQETETILNIEMSTFTFSGYSERLSCLNHNSTLYSSGLALFLNTTKLKVYIQHSHFHNNHGCHGGNLMLLFIQTKDAFEQPAVTMHNVTFEKGRALYGGGLYVSFDFFPSKASGLLHYYQLSSLSVITAFNISNCTFRNNYALKSGGGIFIQWVESHFSQNTYDAEIVDSKFLGNEIGIYGSGGLALHYKRYTESQDRPHQLALFRVNLYIKSCNFSSHTSGVINEHQESKNSVILAKSVPYFRMDGIRVTSNNCTGILAIGSTLLFYGTSVISENIALHGAGIRLCSESLIYLAPYTNLTITGNSAKTIGGGIMVNSKCLINKPMCFYQFLHDVTANYSLLHTINITVQDNNATTAGSNLYGGSIDYCYHLSVNHKTNFFKHHLNIPKNTIGDLSSVSSNPQQVCFVDGTGNKCGKFTNKIAPPGQIVKVKVRVVGQLNGSVPGIVYAYHNESLVLYNSDLTKKVTKLKGEDVSYTMISPTRDISKSAVVLHLGVGSDSGVNEYARYFRGATVSIHFTDCPIGFSMQKRNDIEGPGYICKCYYNYFYYIKKCTLKTEQRKSTLTKNRLAWIGIRKFENITSYLSIKYCPINYCKPEFKAIPVSADNNLLQDLQCQYNRTGIMCGSCPKGWSHLLGNSECSEDCSNMSLFLIIPFALAGLLLILIISVLDLTVTMGTLNGLIFYANLMQDNYIHIITEHPIPVLTPLLHIFLAWFNLDLGMTSCFYRGMGMLAKTMLLGAFPAYLWLIAIAIIILCNKYVRVTRLVGNNAVKVLATLILLSYYKMLKVSISSFNYNDLRVYNIVTGNVSHERKWYLDGNIDYFDFQSHMILLVMAVLFIIVTLPLTLSLLCIKYIFSLSNYCKCFSFIDKLKPFFDVYTGPFKDSARFWPGLLLLSRVIILIAQVKFAEFNLFFYVAVIVCLVLLFIMVMLNGVYKEQFLNVIESSLILNVALMFTSMSKITHAVKAQHLWTQRVSQASISVAFITFIGIMFYHIYLKCSRNQCLQMLIRTGRDLWGNRNLDVHSVEGVRGYEQVDGISSREDEFMKTSDKMTAFPLND